MRIDEYSCIAAVGGGGKTSLIFYLAGLFSARKKVIIATSTHMAYEKTRPFAQWQDTEKIKENLKKYGYTVVGVPAKQPGKITCPPQVDWNRLKDLCDFLLIEADGAKGHPLKVPAAHEPVIPQCAQLVIGVVGLDCVGKPLETVCHRPEETARFLGKSVKDIITEKDVAEICISSRALKKEVGDRAYGILLNKGDDVWRRERAKRICSLIREKNPDQMVKVCALQRKKVAVILLAAGNSKRFGSENKLLYKVDGKSMFERTLETFGSLGCGSLTVVTQREYTQIQEQAKNAGAKIVYNLHPEEGLSSSVKLGILENQDAQVWLLSVCDQPFLKKETLESFMNAYFASGKGIGAAYGEMRMGNPAIFSHSYLEELLELTGDCGGKPIVSAHEEDRYLHPVSPLELKDIDVLE